MENIWQIFDRTTIKLFSPDSLSCPQKCCSEVNSVKLATQIQKSLTHQVHASLEVIPVESRSEPGFFCIVALENTIQFGLI